MTKRQPEATHPRAAPGQLLSIAIATLASKLSSAITVKKSPRFIWRSCSQIKLGQGRPDRCPDCKQRRPCRRASSGREPRREFAIGLLFARFARFEIGLDPTQARIQCDRARF